MAKTFKKQRSPSSSSAAHQPTTTSARADDHRHAWSTVPPIVLLVVGVIVGGFYLWGNLTQIQTSEAWILQTHSAVSLVPRFDLFGQIKEFFTGQLTGGALVADTWGWGIQIVLLVCSIGIERPQLFIHRKYNHQMQFSESVAKAARRRAGIFKTVAFAMIVLDSVADFNYSSTSGVWGQFAFSAITLTMSFFFGLIAYHLIDAGLSEMRS
jgi:hypothetical protein